MHHRIVTTNGIRVHCVEEGEGPLVLLVHGFPESWYSWRHQIPAIAAAGFRAVAIDVRGYGRSSCPRAVDDYRMVKMVGDVVGLLPALGASRACLIGHDWGAPIVWSSALLRPDLFWGVAGFSVPFASRGETPPLEIMRRVAGNEEFYVEYFQRPGRAEAEIEQDVRRWLLGFYWSASGDAPRPAPNIAAIPPGAKMRDRFVVSGRTSRVAHRRRPRLLRRRVRAHRLHRRAQPLPQRRPGLGGLRGVRGRADPGAGALRRRRSRRPDGVGQAVDRAVRADAAAAVALGDPARLRALDPAGAARGDQPPARRFLKAQASGARAVTS